MNVGIALVFLAAAAGVSLLLASGARKRRRRSRAFSGGLDLQTTLDPFPPGLKHLGARLNEPLSAGLRVPPPRAGHSRLGDLIGLH
jgi:hypothetical protein